MVRRFGPPGGGGGGGGVGEEKSLLVCCLIILVGRRKAWTTDWSRIIPTSRCGILMLVKSMMTGDYRRSYEEGRRQNLWVRNEVCG